MSSAVTSPARVVLIEDQLLIRQLLAAVIDSAPGFKLVADCEGVDEGVAACETHRPDLVVLDWKLADGTGDAVMLKAAARRLPLRWLVVSGYQDPFIVRRALHCGAHGFLQKNNPLALFHEALRRVLDGHGYFCPHTSELLARTIRQEAGMPVGVLSAQETAVLRFYVGGQNPKQIADTLKMSPKTVQNHLGKVRQKLGIHDSMGLVRYALEHGLI